jgi:hypothetical protein
MTNLEERIAVLEAREEIKELRARYGWFAARGEAKNIAGLFAPDGIFEQMIDGARRAFKGRDAIHAALSAVMTPGMVFPLIHNDIIVVRGDEATGTCAMESKTSAKAAEAFPQGMVGYYHDRMQRIGGRWYFAERRWFLYAPVFEQSGIEPPGFQWDIAQ